MPQDFLGRIWYILDNNWMSFLTGAVNTMIIALVSTLIGLCHRLCGGTCSDHSLK